MKKGHGSTMTLYSNRWTTSSFSKIGWRSGPEEIFLLLIVDIFVVVVVAVVVVVVSCCCIFLLKIRINDIDKEYFSQYSTEWFLY